MGEQVELKREIGLVSASSLLISIMIGSGIFISPVAILKYSGSFGLCLIIWAVTGFASLLGNKSVPVETSLLIIVIFQAVWPLRSWET